jgi:cysteine desulfurase family protein (TIGR01976 family)
MLSLAGRSAGTRRRKGDTVAFDPGIVRAAYPALRDGHAYLDGAAGTQVPAAVIDAIAGAYREGIGNTGGAFAASARAARIVAQCRAAVADLTGGVPAGVILGPSATALTYRIAAVLSRRWAPGDSIVVSRLDHDANIRPWVQAADRAGATVRWAGVDPATGELPVAQYADLVSSRTRLVAVTAASNILGTRPDVAAIARAAHAVGALVYVDGVHATPHMPVSVAELGADFYATSAYKWAGPHVAAVIAAPELLEPLRPDKLAPSPDDVPERFERGTLPFADLAGVTAAVEHLAGLGMAAADPGQAPGPGQVNSPGPGGGAGMSRRERILASMAAVEAYEGELFGRMLDGLAAMSHVTLYGKAARRAPTAYFNVAGRAPAEVAGALAARGINVWHGDNYACELARALGLQPGGAVRAGLVHYNDASDVERLLAAVASLA